MISKKYLYYNLRQKAPKLLLSVPLRLCVLAKRGEARQIPNFIQKHHIVMVGYTVANPPDNEIFAVMKTYLLG
jgi:hypothetical protein